MLGLFSLRTAGELHRNRLQKHTTDDTLYKYKYKLVGIALRQADDLSRMHPATRPRAAVRGSSTPTAPRTGGRKWLEGRTNLQGSFALFFICATETWLFHRFELQQEGT